MNAIIPFLEEEEAFIIARHYHTVERYGSAGTVMMKPPGAERIKGPTVTA